MTPGIERLFQLPAPSSGNASPEFTSFFSSSSFTCDPRLPWAVLISLAVPPSQAVNFQRQRVEPRYKLREGDLSCGMDGRVEAAAAIGTQLLIGIDRTHVREQQSGAFTWGGRNRAEPLIDTPWNSGSCVCLVWGGGGITQFFQSTTRPVLMFLQLLTRIQRIGGNIAAAPREERRPFCQSTGWLTGADNKAREGRHWRIAASVMECSWGRVAIESSF